MDIEKMHIRPQPYSQPLRIIAQISRFLERSGVPVRDRPS